MLIRYRFYYSSCFFLMCSCCDWFVYMNSLCCIMLKTNEKKEMFLIKKMRDVFVSYFITGC